MLPVATAAGSIGGLYTYDVCAAKLCKILFAIEHVTAVAFINLGLSGCRYAIYPQFYSNARCCSRA